MVHRKMRQNNRARNSRYGHLPRKIRRRYDSVDGLRMLRNSETKLLVSKSNRLRESVQVLMGKEFLSAPLLLKGHGFFLALCSKKGRCHCVSLFRTLGGKFMYYDSSVFDPHPYLKKYLKNHNVPDCFISKARMQHVGFSTCAYHALAFLGYAARSVTEDPKELYTSFVIQMGDNTEGTAVEFVKRLLSETDTGIEVFMTPEEYLPEIGVVQKVGIDDDVPEEIVRLFKKARGLKFKE